MATPVSRWWLIAVSHWHLDKHLRKATGLVHYVFLSIFGANHCMSCRYLSVKMDVTPGVPICPYIFRFATRNAYVESHCFIGAYSNWSSPEIERTHLTRTTLQYHQDQRSRRHCDSHKERDPSSSTPCGSWVIPGAENPRVGLFTKDLPARSWTFSEKIDSWK